MERQYKHLDAEERAGPWQQIIDAIDFMVWDAGKCVGQPDLRINAIQFGGFDQCVGGDTVLALSKRCTFAHLLANKQENRIDSLAPLTHV